MQVILQALGDRVGRKQAHGVIARCPAHADDNHSLSVNRAEHGTVLLNCFAGCDPGAVVDALGLKWSDLFPPNDRESLGQPVARYDYFDEVGVLLYQVVRFEPRPGKKVFIPREAGKTRNGLNGVRRVLYRLPDVVTSPPRAVFLVEGEKCADVVAKLGLVSTTSHGGANGWRKEYAESLRHRHVMILPDNDPPGFGYAEAAASSLAGVAASVRIVVLPGLKEKEDVVDWLAKGGTRADLEALARSVQPERPLPELRSYLKELEARIQKAEADIRRLGEGK